MKIKRFIARRSLILAVILALVGSVMLAGILSSNHQVEAAGPATSYTGAVGITETNAQIMARQAKVDAGPKRAAVKKPEFDADLIFNRTANPDSAALTQVKLRGASVNTASPLVAQTVGINANGPTFNDTPGYFPPDTMGAVGPSQFVVTINGRIRSYSKATGAADGALNADMDTFFQSVESSSASDPHIRYDRTSGRWFVIIIDVAFPNNRVMLAVSNGPTITSASAWTFYFFQDGVGGVNADCLGDYPTPGIDANAVYIGINQFCGTSLNSASYRTSDGFVVRKSSILSGGAIVVTPLRNLVTSSGGPYTPQGVDNPDPSATEGYFIGIDSNVTGKLQLRRVTNPGGSPSVSGNIPISVANTAQPLTQPHKGNTGGSAGQLDGSDGRIFAAYYRSGNFWIALDTAVNSSCVSSGSGDRNAVFWWSLNGIPTGSTPGIAQSGAVCDSVSTSNPTFYTYGTIMVNGQGHAAIGFTVSGANNFVSVGETGRLVSDPAGSLNPVNVYFAGTTAYNPPGDSGSGNGYRRWGDYSFTSLDPCDDMTMWTIQEFTVSSNTYGTRFAQLKAPAPSAPSSASPSSVAAGQSSVSVTISGSGFYDTPANLTDACRRRLSAAVSGGVTVNSLVYNSATSLTLNISTAGASAGAQTVTITNPDGQASSAAVLTISSGSTNTPTFVPPTNTATKTSTVTSTPTTPAPTNTSTATSTPTTPAPSKTSTATSTPTTPAPTNTSTATSTPLTITPSTIPPTNTATNTSTPLPPTATSTATNTPPTLAPTKTNTTVPTSTSTSTGTTTLFSTSLESGQTQPTWTNTVETANGGLSSVGGICCGLTGPELGTRSETAHTGTVALMYSGLDNSATRSYAYLKSFDVSSNNIVITSTTKLSYWIFPQSAATNGLVSGSNSECVAIDMVFSDGSNLRDSGVTDQGGNRLHPASQCGHLTMDQWDNVTANLGALSGKTIARIIVAYDQPANTGGYRGYVDDISITK